MLVPAVVVEGLLRGIHAARRAYEYVGSVRAAPAVVVDGSSGMLAREIGSELDDASGPTYGVE